MIKCAVCLNSLNEPVLVTSGQFSVTSNCELRKGQTRVYFCARCEHLQTEALAEIDSYYDTGYNFMVGSEEEDQIYKVVDGKTIYRLEHQADVFIRKIKPAAGTRILDFGCAKGLSLKRIKESCSAVIPYLFDVSSAYTEFWEKFAEPENCSSYQLRPEWIGEMDVVTSFFVMEHVTDPLEALQNIRSLLKEDGFFYCVIPNVTTNTADYVVVDHVHHYTRNSLSHILCETGFELLEIDEEAHEGAFVFIARKVATPLQYKPIDSTSILARLEEVRSFWLDIAQRVQSFEDSHAGVSKVGIYGAGFYGTYIATCLRQSGKIVNFVDQNPYLQGKSKLDKPIVSPQQMSSEVELLYVGLRPSIARQNIEAIECFRERKLEYFYL